MAGADVAPRLEVAGTVFEVSGLDARGRSWLAERYASFLTDRAPDMRVAARVDATIPDDDDVGPAVAVDDDHIDLRLGGYRFEGDLGRGRLRLIAPPFPSVLSPAAFRFLCSLLVLRAGGVMLHAAGVVDAGRARLFCGPSESGKTTVSHLAAPRAVLSDESVALRPDGGGYRACATPFCGEAGPVAGQTSGDAPLDAVFFLRKSARFTHRRLERREAVQRAFPQVFLPMRVPSLATRVLANLDAMTAAVPCFDLEFAARDELWSYLDGVA